MSTRRVFNKIPLLLTLLVAFGLIAASCGADDTATAASSATETDTEEASSEAASTEAVNTEETGGEEASSGSMVAPSVVLPTVSGGQVDFGSLEGTDTILWYWAPW